MKQSTKEILVCMNTDGVQVPVLISQGTDAWQETNPKTVESVVLENEPSGEQTAENTSVYTAISAEISPEQSSCDVHPTTSQATSALQNIVRTKKNVKRPFKRASELEKATQNVGAFASAQEKQAQAFKDLSETQKHLLQVKRLKLELQERKVLAKEIVAEAQQRQAAAAAEKIATSLEILVKKFTS